MAEVGDRVEVKSKSASRLGVVLSVTGSLLRLRWDDGDETTLVPAPGALRVVEGGAARGSRARRGVAGAAKRSVVKKTSSSSTPAKRPSTRTKPAPRAKATPQRTGAKTAPAVANEGSTRPPRVATAKRPKTTKKSQDPETSSTATVKGKKKKGKGSKKKR